MSMTEHVVLGLYPKHSVTQACITPMGVIAFIEYHCRWFMSYKNVNVIWYQLFWMVVCKSEELDSFYFTASVLQEVYIIRQFFYFLCIP